MTETDNVLRSDGKERLLAAVICLGGSVALLHHDSTRKTEPPLHGMLPWLGFLIGITLLWIAFTRHGRILMALTCLGAACVLIVDELIGVSAMPPYGPLPWLVLLLGLVMMWRAVPLRTISTIPLAIALILLGALPFFPWWLVIQGFWLVLIGYAFPFLVGLIASLPRRPQSRATNPRAP